MYFKGGNWYLIVICVSHLFFTTQTEIHVRTSHEQPDFHKGATEYSEKAHSVRASGPLYVKCCIQIPSVLLTKTKSNKLALCLKKIQAGISFITLYYCCFKYSLIFVNIVYFTISIELRINEGTREWVVSLFGNVDCVTLSDVRAVIRPRQQQNGAREYRTSGPHSCYVASREAQLTPWRRRIGSCGSFGAE